MKKIYAILVAAIMSVSLFADPTQADLQSYMADGYYVACFQAPAGATCNDIYWMGTYVDWNISTPLEELVKCEELAGNAGWYVAKVPVMEGKENDGKPIQLNECGKMTWDVQPGTAAATELVAGTVTIKENGAEYDLQGWSATDPAIIKIGSWKNGYNPCEMVCEAQSYTIRIYPPYCEFLPELEPTIKGSFNQWGDAITMEFKGTYFEYVSEPVTAGFEFKFNNDANGSWDHQFEAYDAENDTWGFVPAEGNLSLNNGTEFYEYDEKNRILTFNFGDDELYRYQGCEEQEEVDSTVYKVLVLVNIPANGPEAGVELVGDFGEDTWNTGLKMEIIEETGWYVTELETMGSKVFKIRELGTWDNQIVYADKADKEGKPVALDNMKFQDYWVDEFHKGDSIKQIELDLSDATKYVWTANWVAPEGIENVVLTKKAQKVIVDGVLYIIRDEKLFNAQGAQVR